MELFYAMLVPFLIAGCGPVGNCCGGWTCGDALVSGRRGRAEGDWWASSRRWWPCCQRCICSGPPGRWNWLGQALEPLLSAVGIPVETIGLLLVRPVSGSAALGVGAELIETYGPDSLVGRTAAVMLGSTETTFYTVAVYFGAAKIAKTRYAIPAALCGDLVGFLAASWAVRMIFGY